MSTITEQFAPMPLYDLVSKIGHFPTASLSEKHSLISDLVKVHPLLSLDFSKVSVFRRAGKIGETQYPSSVQDLLWRAGSIPSVGRANPEGFSVLYLADRPKTAFSEIHVNDEAVLLSELRLREGTSCRIAPVGEFLKIQRTG